MCFSLSEAVAQKQVLWFSVSNPLKFQAELRTLEALNNTYALSIQHYEISTLMCFSLSETIAQKQVWRFSVTNTLMFKTGFEV